MLDPSQMNNILRRDFSQMIYCQNDQDLDKYHQSSQDLERRSRQNRSKEPPEPQPKPEKKDGWVGKDDFK